MTTYADTLKQINRVTTFEAALRGKKNMRQETRKVWAAEVRKLLKALEIKGVSVTAPNYSMAQSIDIRLPDKPIENAQEHIDLHDQLWREGRPGIDCPACRAHQEAKKKLEVLILAAFPDLDNRSEYVSDYFDYCLSIS